METSLNENPTSIKCLAYPLTERVRRHAEVELELLRELYSDDPRGLHYTGIEQLTDQLHRAKETKLALRFWDDGFPLVSIWKWMGDNTALVFILKGGHVMQLNMLLAGSDFEKESEIPGLLKGFLANSEWAEIQLAVRPTLVTLTTVAGATKDYGAFLLGMILIAICCQLCEP